MSKEELKEDTIDLYDIFALVKRSFPVFLIVVPLFAVAALVASYYVPEKFRSTAVLNIQGSYFQHPLVSNLISEIRDPSELNAQRAALLRMALNREYIEDLGERFDVFKYPANHPMRAVERESLLKDIEYFSISPTNFQISIVSKDASSAYEKTLDVLNQMTLTLIERRFQNLLGARDAIHRQAQNLSEALGVTDSPSSRQAELLEVELAKMEASLNALRTRFTDIHPEVLRVQSERDALRQQIMKPEGAPRAAADAEVDYEDVFLSPASRASTQEIFDNLLQNLSHLNIVLQMEADRDNLSYLNIIEKPSIPSFAFFPQRHIFLLLGSALGLVFSGAMVVFFELQRAAFLSPEKAAESLDAPLLGRLPVLMERDRALLLEGRRTPKALPYKEVDSQPGA